MLTSSQRSALVSWLLHCGAVLLILAVTGVKPQNIPLIHNILVVPADIAEYHSHLKPGGGGGGGGVHANTPASRGALPRFAPEQIVPPVVRIDNALPVLPVEPTLIGSTDIKPVVFDYKVWGDPDGAIGKPSGGPGGEGGIGRGHGRGVGPGRGAGHGPGGNGGEGGDAEYSGGGMASLTQPVLLTKVDPEYSEEARKVRLQGTVRLKIVVDTHGQAQNITVSQSLGLGLDDRAVDAVKKWKFLPARRDGKPTAVMAYVDVNFRLL